jgi:fructokinase
MSAGRVVCLGEAVVDLVGSVPAPDLPGAAPFTPAPGGSLANIAVAAARFGAEVEFLGGAADDDWGHWLREHLAGEGVGVSRFVLAPRGTTSLAFVSHGPGGEPRFHFHECPDRPAAHAGPHLETVIGDEPGVVVLGSDSLLVPDERGVTMQAAALAAERGSAVLVDPNLRPARWPGREPMLNTVRELVTAADVVKCNEDEAVKLTGEGGAEAAALALCGLGPQAAVVTRSEHGAVLASDGTVVAVPAPDAGEVVDTTGAGDSVTGVLAAALAFGGPAALEPALVVAMRAAAGVVAATGALAGLPPADDARAELEVALSPPG